MNKSASDSISAAVFNLADAQDFLDGAEKSRLITIMQTLSDMQGNTTDWAAAGFKDTELGV